MNLIAALCLFPALTVSVQEPVELHRIFKEGETDLYAIKLSLSVSLGDVDIHVKTRQTVKKTFGNGEADIESELLDLKTAVNGDPMEIMRAPETKVSTSRVNAMGMPVRSSEKSFGFSFLQFVGLLSDRPLKPGETAQVAWTDPTEPKRKVSGKVRLESAEAGIAKLTSNWEVATPSSSKPLKIDMTSFVSIASGKIERGSGTIVGAQADIPIQAIQFTLQRETPSS